MMRIVGIGCRSDATENALYEAIERAMIASPGPLDAIATTEERSGSATVLATAKRLHLKIIPVTESEIRGLSTPTQSPRIMERFGVGSLAEATALFAAGPNANLLCERQVSSDGAATAAIAQGDRL